MDAAGKHIDAALTANELLVGSAHALLKGKVESGIAAAGQPISTILEAASSHAAAWSDFQRRVHGIHASLLRELQAPAPEEHRPARQDQPTKPLDAAA